MADWGPPSVDFFGKLSGIGETLQSNLKTGRRNAAVSSAMDESGRVDYAKAIGGLIRVNDLEGAGKMAAVAKAVAAPETTEAIKNFQYSQRNPAFAQYEIARRRAGATNVSVNTGEKEYDKVLNKAEAERFINYQKAGQSANSALQSLDVLERAMRDSNFYSGPGAERFALPLRQAQAAFGGDPKAAASMETFRATASKAALDAMGGSLGSGFSNADRDFVLNQVPNLSNTVDGNKQLIEASRKIRQREIDIAKMARDYARRNKGRLNAGFDDELADFAAKNPLFKQQAGNASSKRLKFNPATGGFE